MRDAGGTPTPPPQVNDHSPDRLRSATLFGAGAIGTLFLIVGDMINNRDSATVLKLGKILESGFDLSHSLSGYVSTAALILMACGLCWVYEPRNKAEAFLRGFAVFATISVASPDRNVSRNPPPPPGETEHPSMSIPKSYPSILIPKAYGAPADVSNSVHSPVASQSLPGANATVQVNSMYISDCKPSYYGFLGLGSFFNNSLKLCIIAHKLVFNERVKLLDVWPTWPRQYKYAEIKYLLDGEERVGWVPAGQGDEPWAWIRPDDPANPFAPAPAPAN